MRVKAENTVGNAPWSDVLTFDTRVNSPPTTPLEISPISTDTKDASQNIIFTWNLSTDLDNDPITYKIRIWNITTDTTVNNLTNTPYTLPPNKLKGNSQYNYTITASDGKSETTNSTTTFNTLNHPPSAPTAISPTCTYTNDTTQNIIFTWNLSTDLDNAPVTYKLRIWNATKDTTITNSNTNDQVVTARIANSELTLSFSTVNTGSAEIQISASSNGKDVQLKFKVEVKLPTGIDPLPDIETIQVYPNPTKGQVHIKFKNAPKVGTWITVIDFSGKIISKTLADKNELYLNLTGNSSGLYLIRIEEKNPKTYKIILE